MTTLIANPSDDIASVVVDADGVTVDYIIRDGDMVIDCGRRHAKWADRD